MPGDYRVTIVSGVPVMSAPAEIDLGNADQLRAAILDTMAHGHATLVVDMTVTQFCDSAGLRELVHAHRRARAEGGEARMVITSAVVLRIFAISGMDRVVPNFATVQDALTPKPPAVTTTWHTGSPATLAGL